MFHGVKIQDAALIAAATLSDRYITDRFLPDKAIDLIDEACAMIRTEMDSMPTELDEVRRKILQHEIEEAALKKRPTSLPKSSLPTCRKSFQSLRDKFNSMKAKWENEKNSISSVQKLREDIEACNAEIDKAERDYDLNKLAEPEIRRSPSLKNSLRKKSAKRNSARAKTPCCATALPTRR